jgi:hypothetical protein
MLGSVEFSQIPPRIRYEDIQDRLVGMMERQDPRAMVRMNVDPTSLPETREFSILGRSATFRVVDGTLVENQTPVRRLSGVFRSKKAYLALDYVIPSAEYDEAAILTMIESIRPAAEDSMSESDVADPEAEGKSQRPADNTSNGESADTEMPEVQGRPDRE